MALVGIAKIRVLNAINTHKYKTDTYSQNSTNNFQRPITTNTPPNAPSQSLKLRGAAAAVAAAATKHKQ